MTRRRAKVTTDQVFEPSDRLRFILTGMAYASESDEALNSALNWFYFSLVLSMVDPLAAAGILCELEEQPAWTDEFRQLTRENATLALERSGRYIEGKEAKA